MATWTSEELLKIAAAEELELASVRPDDTLGKPVTIWVVRVGDDLYVRSWRGTDDLISSTIVVNWSRVTVGKFAEAIENSEKFTSRSGTATFVSASILIVPRAAGACAAEWDTAAYITIRF